MVKRRTSRIETWTRTNEDREKPCAPAQLLQSQRARMSSQRGSRLLDQHTCSDAQLSASDGADDERQNEHGRPRRLPRREVALRDQALERSSIGDHA